MAKQPSMIYLRTAERFYKDLNDAHRALHHAAAMAQQMGERVDDPTVEGAGEVAATMARNLKDLIDRLYPSEEN